MKTVLVAGASGFAGTAAVERFAADGAQVIGLSRRPPVTAVPGVEYVSVDLRDAAACAALASRVKAATHLVYAAVNETPGDLVAAWSDQHHAARNAAMFDNLLAVLADAAAGLRHIAVVHGTKAYAVQRGNVHLPVPLRESLPRPGNDDFYFRQEDALQAAATVHGWDWTVLRAPIICGGGRGSNLNNLLAIAVFASLCRDAGLGLAFPGAASTGGMTEMVDVSLLARALAWSGETPAARNQVFNVANGDVFRWTDLWPLIAAAMGMAVAETAPRSVRAYIDGEAARWSALVQRHGLTTGPGMAFLGESASLLDFALAGSDRTVVTSTIKIRQAGFHACTDTAHSIAGWLQRWREERLIPPL